MLGPILAQGGVQLANSAFNSWMNRRAQSREFQNNRQMSELAYKNDLDMWNRQSSYNQRMWDLQNEYNLPSAQMQRLKDAGLNPNLIYGNGAAGGQAAQIQKAEMPKYSPARANFSHMPLSIPDMLGAFQNFKLKSAQIDNVKASTDVQKERSLTEALMRMPKFKSMTYGNQVKYANARFQQAFNELQLQTSKQRMKNLAMDHTLKGMDIPYRQSRNQIKSTEADWLKKYGVRQQDPLWMRLFMQMIDLPEFNIGNR